MFTKRLMWVLWPAFLMAGVMEALVFSVVDPRELYWFGQHIEGSREAVYTIAFFLFWFITSLGGGLTILLSLTPQEVNHTAEPDRP